MFYRKTAEPASDLDNQTEANKREQTKKILLQQLEAKVFYQNDLQEIATGIG